MGVKKRMFFCLAFCLFLCGCRQAPPAPLCHVVETISVTYDDGTHHLTRTYSDSEKTRQILNYLRLLDPYGTPTQDPETVDGCRYRITLHFSDGEQQQYVQKGNLFLRGLDGIWRNIDPEKGQKLSWILGKTKSDAVSMP